MYRVNEDEKFHLGNMEFDVAKGWEIANEKKLTPQEYPLKDCAQFLGFMHVDKDYAMKSERNDPLLAVTLLDKQTGEIGIIIIDGHHRMYRDRQNGVENVQVVVLSLEDTKKIDLTIKIKNTPRGRRARAC